MSHDADDATGSDAGTDAHSDTRTDTASAADTDDSGGDSTYFNAFVGAVASVVLAFLPFSTVIGGALAGYLQGPETDEGLRVGALAGVFLLVPALLLALLFGGALLAVFPFAGEMGPRMGAGAGLFGVVAFLFLLVFGAVYVVGFSALGGVIGAYVNRET
jgi:hypothetical protein